MPSVARGGLQIRVNSPATITTEIESSPIAIDSHYPAAPTLNESSPLPVLHELQTDNPGDMSTTEETQPSTTSAPPPLPFARLKEITNSVRKSNAPPKRYTTEISARPAKLRCHRYQPTNIPPPKPGTRPSSTPSYKHSSKRHRHPLRNHNTNSPSTAP
jgi:hypothetical protein